jgi:hypothetical protein
VRRKHKPREWPEKVPYYKPLGGYICIVRWRGRWYFVGSTATAIVSMCEAVRLRGFDPVRADPPQNLSARLHPHGGNTLSAFRAAFPNFWKAIKEDPPCPARAAGSPPRTPPPSSPG